MVDALASGASDRKVVEVQVLSWAPKFFLDFNKLIHPKIFKLSELLISPDSRQGPGKKTQCLPFLGILEINFKQLRPVLKRLSYRWIATGSPIELLNYKLLLSLMLVTVTKFWHKGYWG